MPSQKLRDFLQASPTNHPYASSSSTENPLYYRASQRRKSVSKAGSVNTLQFTNGTGTISTQDLSNAYEAYEQVDVRYREGASSVNKRSDMNRRLLDVDCTQLFTSEIYDFIIGEEETSFKVHGAVLKGLSEPLWYMLHNSNMQESITKTVRIADHEPEVFAKFLKFAYLGFCGISDGATIQSVRQTPLPTYFRCHICAIKCVLYKNQDYPFSGPDCRQAYNASVAGINLTRSAWVYCVVHDCSNYWQADGSKNLLCRVHRDKAETIGYSGMREVNDPVPGLQDLSQCSLEFVQRRYGCGKLSHEDLSRLLRQHDPDEKAISPFQDKVRDVPLLDHAKLYVFAHQYIIEDLQDISLHKLHRNLTVTDITDESIAELIELVAFSYDRTSEEGDIVKASGDRLRSLVMAFILDRKEALMGHSDFRELLARGGSLTADFFGLAFVKK